MPEHENNHYTSSDASGRFEIPDQRLFEPDPELEEKEHTSTWKRVWPFIRFFVAGLALIGMLYLAGGYQAFLLRPTAETVAPDEHAARVDVPEIVIPVRVFLVSSRDESFGTSRDAANAQQLVANARRIWHQARVTFDIYTIERLRVSPEDEEVFHADPRSFVRSHSSYDPDAINVFLTGTLSGINGVALGGTRSVAVADVVSHYDFRTLAHEIGHILSLEHTQDRARIMAQGAYGTKLTHKEIEQARAVAKDLRGN